MKESKVIIICFSILLIIILILLYLFPILRVGIYFDIILGIITGMVVSIATAICQYFVIRGRIKRNIYNSYFDLYKTIYTAENQKILFHYPVLDIWKSINNLSVELSKNLGDYSGFINDKYSHYYKKINPLITFNNKTFNFKNFFKLILPINSSKFNDIILPIKKNLESILLKIDKHKFKSDFSEFVKIYNYLLNKKEKNNIL